MRLRGPGIAGALRDPGGAKAFTEAIDQLFGYASWRDTKLALIVFVREKGLTAIIEKAREALAAHPQFVSWEKGASETELRAVVRQHLEFSHSDAQVYANVRARQALKGSLSSPSKPDHPSFFDAA